MAVSKSKRFEIFKRDGFTCQYCGQRAGDVVLELDHIHPVSKGGGDDPMNLITACFDCNRGKRAETLGEVAPKPDADLEFLAVQQETAELRRYLAAKDEREGALLDASVVLAELWNDFLNPYWQPKYPQFKSWLLTYSPDEIETAIMRASHAFRNKRIQGQETVPYVSGILRNMRKEADNA